MRNVVAILSALFVARPAAAHDGALAAATNPSSWDVAVLVLLAAMGVLYALGSQRLATRRARVRRVERVGFWAGWVALVGAVAPPLDGAAATRFSAHMAQHELLTLVGAPLLIVGRPIVPWLWALPARFRSAAGRGLQGVGVRSGWQRLTHPAVAWAAHGAVIWIWHAPVLYQAAVVHEGIHALQHATLVGTAVLFWWGLVYGRYGRAAYGASVLFVFTTMVHTGVLGALFALSATPFYGVYRERAAAAGVDAVADQQLAGLYMWVPTGIVMTLFGLALLMAWLSEAERRASTGQRTGVLLLSLVLAAAAGQPPPEPGAAIRSLVTACGPGDCPGAAWSRPPGVQSARRAVGCCPSANGGVHDRPGARGARPAGLHRP